MQIFSQSVIMSREMVKIGATVNVSQYILLVPTWDAGGPLYVENEMRSKLFF